MNTADFTASVTNLSETTICVNESSVCYSFRTAHFRWFFQIWSDGFFEPRVQVDELVHKLDTPERFIATQNLLLDPSRRIFKQEYTALLKVVCNAHSKVN
jgi:hypothetical protein